MVANPSGGGALPSTAYVTRLLAASSRLSEPGRSLFDRVFLKGESEAAVMAEMSLTQADFNQVRTNVLRSLMIAAQ